MSYKLELGNYKETCECPCEIILANDPKAILKGTPVILIQNYFTNYANQ